MCDNKNEDSQSVNEAIEMLKWEKLFQNKNIYNQLKFSNETKVNIVHNCISSKYIACDDKEALWLKDHTKRLTNKENEIFRK